MLKVKVAVMCSHHSKAQFKMLLKIVKKHKGSYLVWLWVVVMFMNNIVKTQNIQIKHYQITRMRYMNKQILTYLCTKIWPKIYQ